MPVINRPRKSAALEAPAKAVGRASPKPAGPPAPTLWGTKQPGNDAFAATGRAGPAGAKPLARTDPALLEAVRDFEKAGGRGRWFSSVSPFADKVAPRSFYLMQSLPLAADPRSSVLLMRSEPTRQYLQQLMQKGEPLVLGSLPVEETQVQAAALGDDVKLAADAISAGGIKDHKSIVLMQPTSSKSTLAHESQHWLDFENPGFDKSIEQTLKPFLEAKALTQEDRNWLWRLAVEVRGHQAQAIRAMDDAAKGLPFVDGVGNVVTGSKKKLAEDYDFEASSARLALSQTYSPVVADLAQRLKDPVPALARDYVKAMARFDLAGAPEGMKFAKVFGPYLTR